MVYFANASHPPATLHLLALAALLLAGLALWPATAAAAAKTFAGPGNDWHAAQNWVPVGVPAAADDVVLSSPATLSSGPDAAVNSLTVNAELGVAGASTLAVGAGGATIVAAVTLGGSGVLRVGGNSTWSGGQLQFSDPVAGGTLEVAGTLSISGDRQATAAAPGAPVAARSRPPLGSACGDDCHAATLNASTRTLPLLPAASVGVSVSV